LTHKKSMTAAFRHQLVLDYVQYVQNIARHIAYALPPCVDVDDLISVGFIGLMDAIEKFDYQNGASFKTYAAYRVRGSIQDYLRSHDMMSRNVRDKHRAIENARRSLETRLQRTASLEEIATFLDISIEDLHEMRAQSQHSLMLSLNGQETSETQADAIENIATSYQSNALEILTRQDQHELMCKWIEQLPEPQNIVVKLYYFEGLSFKEIGVLNGYSESRACQIHSSAIHKLRKMTKWEDEDVA
jgi:RNA polymerase sigma factor FliA